MRKNTSSRNSAVSSNFRFWMVFILTGLSFIAVYHLKVVTGQTQDELLAGHDKNLHCTGCAARGDQSIYIPLTNLAEAQGSQIVFNSRSDQAMEVTPVFYTLDGTIITGEPVSIKSTEIRYVDLKTMIPAEHRNRQDWGGLSLKYYGANREMWAQFRFLGINSGNNVDEFFVVESEQRSDTQAATWWTPPNSTAVLAFGNATDENTTARIQFGNGETQNIELAPRATTIIRHDQSEQADKNVESFLITTTGAAGSIISTGVLEGGDARSNSVIRFYDTKLARQPNLYANGLNLKNTALHMILNNTSPSSISATPKFIPNSGLGANPFIMPAVQLAPYQTLEVDLSRFLAGVRSRRDFDTASVIVESNSNSGNLIGALYTTDKNTGFAYDIPLRDSGPVRTMTGSYPWKIDDDFSTVVYITNITDIPQEFVSQVNFEGGKYTIKPRRLAPGGTAEIDMKKLRLEQKTDDLGGRIPLNAEQGQFRWAVHGVTGGKLALIGRAVMKSNTNRIMTSYSCNDPCPPEYGGWVSPTVINLLVGGSGTMTGWEIAWYSGSPIGPYQAGADWSMDSPDFCTMGSNNGSTATFTAIAPGSTWVTAFFGTFEKYSWDGLNCFDDNNTYDVIGGGPVDVAPTATITAIKAVGKNHTTKIRVEVVNPSNYNINLSLTTLSGTGSAQFTSTNSSTQTITQTTDVEVKGITESSTKRNIQLEAKYNGTSLGTMRFTVVLVTLSLKYTISDNVSTDNSALSVYQSAMGRTTLGGPLLSPGTGGVASLWRQGIEIKGIVTPSDFDEFVVLERERVEDRSFDDQTLLVRHVNCADMSSLSFLDEDPQSDGSAGKVYDLDAPGIMFQNPSLVPAGTILRRRTNFRHWAAVTQLNGANAEDVVISDDITSYERISIIKTKTGTALATNVPGDNVLGSGTTNLTWNLASGGTPPSPTPCS